MKSKLLFLIPLGLLLCLIYLQHPAQVLADRLESNSYIIQFGNFNVTSGEKSNANFKVTDTVGQTADGPFSNSNYFVGSGFQYIYQIGEFAFSISDLGINFGDLIINNDTTDAHTLTISTRGASGYNVYAYEHHPLRHTADGVSTISDTTCDNNDCDQTAAKIWITQGKYGFGFNISGDDIPADFINTDYYRQFADNSLAESMQPVMSSSSAVTNHQATIKYKVQVGPNQAAGTYQTHIVFVAVPGY